jgi:hypothetical protein
MRLDGNWHANCLPLRRKALQDKDLRRGGRAGPRRKPLQHKELRRFDTANAMPNTDVQYSCIRVH